MITQTGRKETAERITAEGSVQAHRGDLIREDPNSWAMEHLPDRFSHLHLQNLKAFHEYSICTPQCLWKEMPLPRAGPQQQHRAGVLGML